MGGHKNGKLGTTSFWGGEKRGVGWWWRECASELVSLREGEREPRRASVKKPPFHTFLTFLIIHPFSLSLLPFCFIDWSVFLSFLPFFLSCFPSPNAKEGTADFGEVCGRVNSLFFQLKPHFLLFHVSFSNHIYPPVHLFSFFSAISIVVNPFPSILLLIDFVCFDHYLKNTIIWCFEIVTRCSSCLTKNRERSQVLWLQKEKKNSTPLLFFFVLFFLRICLCWSCRWRNPTISKTSLVLIVWQHEHNPETVDMVGRKGSHEEK